MKKLLMIVLSLALSSTAFAYTETREINQSSFTKTNEGPVWVQISSTSFPFFMANTSPNTDFRGIVIGSVTTGGVINVYDSQGSATNQIASITLNAANDFHYNVRLSSGLTYTTTGNSGGVTILFHIN